MHQGHRSQSNRWGSSVSSGSETNDLKALTLPGSKYYIIYVTDISRLPVVADAIHASFMCILKAHHFFGTISRSSKPRMVSSRRRA
jgi:hypothetical protein